MRDSARTMMSLGSSNRTESSSPEAVTTMVCDKLLPNWLCYCVLLLGVCVVVENILLVATIWRGSSTSLAESSYVFLASLAVADGLVGGAGLVLTISYLRIYPEDGHVYPPSNFLSVVIIIDQTLMLISVIHMAVLALDRYLYILEPFVYVRRVTRKIIMATVAGTWFIGILTMSLPSLHYISHPWTPFCEAMDTHRVFAVSMSSAYLVVVALTCFAYFKIFREVKRHERSIAVLRVPPPHGSDSARVRTTTVNPPKNTKTNFHQGNPSTTASSQNHVGSTEDEIETQSSSESESFHKKEKWKSTLKLVKFLLLVFGTFIALTLPSTLSLLLSSLIQVRRDVAFFLVSLLPVNCSVNFFIVLYRDGAFRKELKRLIRDTGNFIGRNS